MELQKPLISLKQFTGMGENGIYFLDGFLPKKLQGQTVLTQGWGSYSFIPPSTSGFASLSTLIGLAVYQHVSDNQVAALDDQGNIFDFNNLGVNKQGLIHQIPSTGTLIAGLSGGMFATRKGNILYSSANHLGVGWVGKATGGSTSTLIDTTRNFTDLGLSNAAGSNKVFNLTKGALYTITSISTTTNTNDTLNFGAGTATGANDWYIAFSDMRFTFGTTNVANLHFSPQPATIYWNRQIILWNGTYYILNGNYIAALAVDETTWTADLVGAQTAPSDKFKKQFPSNHHGIMFDYNQDRMLVATYNQGRGALLLWDGYSPNWISILETDTPAAGMDRYGSGWVVLIGASLYYTDGYSLQYLDKLPDSLCTDVAIPKKSNMVSTEDGILISFSGSTGKRLVPGVYSFNIKDRTWAYLPMIDKNGKGNQTAPNLFLANKYDTGASRGTPNVIAGWTEIAKIVNQNAKKSSVLMYIKLPQKMGITGIELNLAPKNDSAPTSTSQTNKVRVNYGQGIHPMYSVFTPGGASTTTMLANASGAYMVTRVGQKIFVQTGSTGYESSYITSIANGGTSGEQLTVSPAFSVAPTTPVRVLDLYPAGSLDVCSASFPQETRFTVPSFYSDKIWIEVVMENQDVFPLDLAEVHLYG